MVFREGLILFNFAKVPNLGKVGVKHLQKTFAKDVF